MSSSDQPSDLLLGAPLSRAAQLISRLIWLYGTYAGVLSLLLAARLVPLKADGKLASLSREFAAGGLGETTLSIVLLTLIALVAAGLVAHARLWNRRVEAALEAGEIDNPPPSLLAILWRRGPGFLAREGQAVLVGFGAAAVVVLVWMMWPSPKAAAAVANDANLIAALIIGLAFPALIAERMMASFPKEQMPEAPGLRRLLLLATLILALAGVAEIGRGLHFTWIAWVFRALSLPTALVALELLGRALFRLFLPRPAPETAKAATDSVVAAIVTAGPRSPGNLIRTHLGLDFARSWALAYVSAVAVPFLIGTVLFCWFLTGVKLLGPDQRGIYERFGDPVAVLQPGFHVIMPWPLGRMRPVENGTIHTVAAGVEEGAAAVAEASKAEKIGAEAAPTAAMARGWETIHATQAAYLVADDANAAQGFQVVNTEILVFYRTGLTDQAAREAVYSSASPAKIVEQEADRLALRYFSSHTLNGVMGAERDNLQENLRADLSRAIASYKIGVEIVAVLVNEIHPPAGAAEAYHAVQKAGIDADANAFLAQARAERRKGQASEEAYRATSSAAAGAVESMQSMTGDAARFAAERQAYALSPNAFLLERRARNLIQGLRGRSVMIVDHRLSGDQVPVIDLRNSTPAPAGIPAQSNNSTPYVPDLPRSTSTERSAP